MNDDERINIIGLPPKQAQGIKDALTLKAAHQAGEHRGRLDPVCSSCTKTVMLARGWEASERDLAGLDLTDDEVVRRYLHHAQRMSES